MDRRHLKILILLSLGLVPAGLGNLRSQGPGGPGFREGKNQGALLLREQEGRRRLEELPPEERGTFERNLAVWHALPPEERMAIRSMALARKQEEIDKALTDTGLHLNQDQREMFTLRYTQERRKLERELQRQIATERARRMPEMLARLKAEFGAAATSPAVRSGALPMSEVRPEPLVSPSASPVYVPAR